jgi:hypothetical protein
LSIFRPTSHISGVLWAKEKKSSAKLKRKAVKTRKPKLTFEKPTVGGFSGYGKPIGFDLGFGFPLGSGRRAAQVVSSKWDRI